jgi:two-component sensor histidine kinase
MPGARIDAQWSNAIRLTVALWLFMLLIFLPALIARNHADWRGVAIDSTTILVSIGFALGIFAVFRATVDRTATVRGAILAFAILTVSSLQIAFDLLFTEWIAHNFQASWAMVRFDSARVSASMLNYVCVFTVNVALFQLSFSRRRSLTAERQLAAARSAAQQAQLEALRLQLNPHFLFNTLNAISSMIITKRNDDAELMTDKLSSFLRASLACDPSELVLVDEELGLTGDYLDIEGVRFGDRLRVEISSSAEARDVRIPGMLIQPLVENAIKYGVATSRAPVTITIEATVREDTLCLTVTNDVGTDAVSAKTAGAGVGLKNVRRRLAALYGDKASLDARPLDGGFRAQICVPAHRKTEVA